MIILVDENEHLIGCYDNDNPMPTYTQNASLTMDKEGEPLPSFYIDFPDSGED